MNRRMTAGVFLALLLSLGCRTPSDRINVPAVTERKQLPGGDQRGASEALASGAPGKRESTAPEGALDGEACAAPEEDYDTTEGVVAATYSQLYDLLRIELQAEEPDPTTGSRQIVDARSGTKPSHLVTEAAAKAVVCAAVDAGGINSLPQPRPRTQLKNGEAGTICEREGVQSVRVGRATWYFMGVKSGGFVAARDAGQPTPSMRAVYGFPTLRLIPVGEYVLVEVSSTIFYCPSSPDNGCDAGGQSETELYCTDNENERCLPTGNKHTDLHVVDPIRRCVLDFGSYRDQAIPEYTVKNGVLQVRSKNCLQEYSGALQSSCGEAGSE